MRKFERLEKFINILADYELKNPEEIFPPSINGQFAFDCIIEAFLGPGYYVVGPIHTGQCNTAILDKILKTYSKDYRKLIKRKRKELKHYEQKTRSDN